MRASLRVKRSLTLSSPFQLSLWVLRSMKQVPGTRSSPYHLRIARAGWHALGCEVGHYSGMGQGSLESLKQSAVRLKHCAWTKRDCMTGSADRRMVLEP